MKAMSLKKNFAQFIFFVAFFIVHVDAFFSAVSVYRVFYGSKANLLEIKSRRTRGVFSPVCLSESAESDKSNSADSKENSDTKSKSSSNKLFGSRRLAAAREVLF